MYSHQRRVCCYVRSVRPEVTVHRLFFKTSCIASLSSNSRRNHRIPDAARELEAARRSRSNTSRDKKLTKSRNFQPDAANSIAERSRKNNVARQF